MDNKTIERLALNSKCLSFIQNFIKNIKEKKQLFKVGDYHLLFAYDNNR